MTGQANLLYQLQIVDLNLAKRRTRLKEIAALLTDNAKITAAQAELTARENALKPWQLRSINLDLEIQSLTRKIAETDDRLYGGMVRNPKELQDLQNDIASLQKRKGQLEDTLIDAMMHVEEGQASVEEAQTTLKQVTAIETADKVDLRAEQTRLQGEVQELEAKRKEAVQVIDAAALKQYEALRVPKRGQPVAPLVGDSCKLCGVEQTSMNAQKVHQGHALTFCESCGRILVSL